MYSESRRPVINTNQVLTLMLTLLPQRPQPCYLSTVLHATSSHGISDCDEPSAHLGLGLTLTPLPSSSQHRSSTTLPVVRRRVEHRSYSPYALSNEYKGWMSEEARELCLFIVLQFVHFPVPPIHHCPDNRLEPLRYSKAHIIHV